MRIANVLAGFSLAEADVLRKAVGKKDAGADQAGSWPSSSSGPMALGHPTGRWSRSWPPRS